ncbi:Phosphoglucosamine mutase [Pseudoalteromonas sp. P1-30]|uniref:phosphomannomutase n=1 Tax=Pseudoalteromonas sp. P1-30 TaxID=1723760 RepID=UPI0006D620D4|nr:phosphomannomutase [Pseudoalteromonas sp. P1-30]KPV91506.1 Phosphoglucosamine mutase [Pseudoalteromonas sp. P1-30]
MNKKLISSKVISQCGIVFGTSGARGLVEDFTPDVCAAFAIAFVKSIDNEFSFNTVALAIDNRPSSYAMAQACAQGLKQLNIDTVYYGVIPTPALAYKAMQDCMPCIMITGSHIPFDRNGLKFYRPDGEITKDDERAILHNDAPFMPLSESSVLTVSNAAEQAYISRYAALFSADALAGKKIGIYEHSSAGRDIYKSLFESLGAEVTSLERSDTFVPIDTEAVSDEDKQKAREWSKAHGFDAIFSTDGDGDRPLVADENGEWLRGDILGLLCSQLLGIDALAVPVSCNTAIEKSGYFKHVARTKIGSPYVIAEFSDLNRSYQNVAGFEANGGYLLGKDIQLNDTVLTALPTRDALLPALVLFMQQQAISELTHELPSCYTASDRLKNFSKENSMVLMNELKNDAAYFLSYLGYEEAYSVNTIDGLRIALNCGDIVHLRPSGNAPELRCYAESTSEQLAEKLVVNTLKYVTKH